MLKEGLDLEVVLEFSWSVRLSILRHLVVMVRPLLRLTPPVGSWCLRPGSGVEVVISAWDPEYSSLSLSSVSWLVRATLARKLSRWWEVVWLRSVRWDWDLVILDLLEVEGGLALAAAWDCCLQSPLEEELEPDLRLRLI